MILSKQSRGCTALLTSCHLALLFYCAHAVGSFIPATGEEISRQTDVRLTFSIPVSMTDQAMQIDHSGSNPFGVEGCQQDSPRSFLLENRELTQMESESRKICKNVERLQQYPRMDEKITEIVGNLKWVHNHFSRLNVAQPSLVEMLIERWKKLESLARVDLPNIQPLHKDPLIRIMFYLGDFMIKYKLMPPDFLRSIQLFQAVDLAHIVNFIMYSRSELLILSIYKPNNCHALVPTLEFLKSHQIFEHLRRAIKALDEEGQRDAVFACLYGVMEFLERKRDKSGTQDRNFEEFSKGFLGSKAPSETIRDPEIWRKMIHNGIQLVQQPPSKEGPWQRMALLTVYFFLVFVDKYDKEVMMEVTQARNIDLDDLRGLIEVMDYIYNFSRDHSSQLGSTKRQHGQIATEETLSEAKRMKQWIEDLNPLLNPTKCANRALVIFFFHIHQIMFIQFTLE
ncbi:hypothetical protein PGTUg99_024706 [Puccinia graminis f. sp. tritici]|uniref:Uncharacterized protein n=1 Tax=Puccinia graminis f. sp. tritici TaxID=56615 RepID=A0A5B0Q490_PUCGR|nr:hypothetical protein PGTUg99_024706 [Puccinia graminis f. sp. tritici]